MFSQPSFAPASASSLSVSGFDFAASTRGGVSSVGASVTLSSMMGGMYAGSTTMGFGFRTGDGGRAVDLHSTHTPMGLAQFISMGAAGINPMQTSPALQAHMAASAMILQATSQVRRLDFGPILAAMAAAGLTGGTMTTTGAIVLGTVGGILASDAVDGTREALDPTRRSMAAAGMPDPDDEDGKGKKKDKKDQQWDSWKNLPKEEHDGKTYARIGDRLYTQHAVDRMQPSGLGAPAGQVGAGRNVAPRFVEDAIQTGTRITQVTGTGVVRSVIRSGNLEIITENADKIIVSVLRVG